jgi:hypothetical protein
MRLEVGRVREFNLIYWESSREDVISTQRCAKMIYALEEAL